MAERVLTNAFVSINGVDLSANVRSVTLTYEAELQDSTAMSDTARERLPGLKNWSAAIEFRQDYAAGQVDATLFSLIGAANFPVIFRADAGVIAVTNPQLDGNALLENYVPIGGTVGELQVAPTSLQGVGDLTRTTV